MPRMKQDLYVYYSNADRERHPCPNNSMDMDFGQMVLIAKTPKFLKQIWKYQNVTLFVPTVEALPRPFLTAVICRLMARRYCLYQDEQDRMYRIGLGALLREFGRYIMEHLTFQRALQTVAAELNALEQRSVGNAKLSADVPPAYLRCDFSYGYAAGGSIGHIAGVLSHLGDYCGREPLFLSTDKIPTVEIPCHVLRGPAQYRNLRDVAGLFFSNTVYEKAMEVIGTQPISMLYQRSALNSYAGVKIALEKQVPYVLEYNGSEVWASKNWAGRKTLRGIELSEQIERLTFEKADLIVCVSEPLRQELLQRGIADKKILVNPNGVNPERYRPDLDGQIIRQRYGITEQEVVIGFIGTFGAWHGAEVLAQAFSQLVQKQETEKPVRLLLVGDGMQMPVVRSVLTQAGVMDRCILTGMIPQIQGPSYLAACDILVSPQIPNPDGTPFFGSPTKLFEYMAMGKAIAASDLDQIGEVISHEKTGLLCKPGDVESLKSTLLRLVENAALRNQLGSAARRAVVEQYTWEAHVKRIMDKLQELCGKSQ